jgi:hypothetical protein
LSVASEIEVLSLIGTNITDQGTAHLLSFGQIRQLSLGQTSLTDESVKVLSKLTSLKYLEIQGSRITPPGADAIRAALPNCDVTSEWGTWGL